MLDRLKRLKAPFLSVLGFLLLAFGLIGCEKETDSAKPIPRSKDAVYQKQLRDLHQEQWKANKARVETIDALEKLIAQARTVLPKDATSKQIKDELDGHPEKYPAWKELCAQAATNAVAQSESLKKARALVRERILKEMAGGGKAKSATQKKAN